MLKRLLVLSMFVIMFALLTGTAAFAAHPNIQMATTVNGWSMAIVLLAVVGAVIVFNQRQRTFAMDTGGFQNEQRSKAMLHQAYIKDVDHGINPDPDYLTTSSTDSGPTNHAAYFKGGDKQAMLDGDSGSNNNTISAVR